MRLTCFENSVSFPCNVTATKVATSPLSDLLLLEGCAEVCLFLPPSELSFSPATSLSEGCPGWAPRGSSWITGPGPTICCSLGQHMRVWKDGLWLTGYDVHAIYFNQLQACV